MIKCFDSDIFDEEKQALNNIIDSRILAFGPHVSEFESQYKKYSKKKI